MTFAIKMSFLRTSEGMGAVQTCMRIYCTTEEEKRKSKRTRETKKKICTRQEIVVFGSDKRRTKES
jgi:hypothetical protein